LANARERVLTQKLQDSHKPSRARRFAVDRSNSARNSVTQAGSFQSRYTGAWSSAPGVRSSVAR
jgi:hypothetical protein